MDKPSQILQFWFEGIDDAAPIDKKKNPFKKWFTKDERFDQAIREKFEKDLMIVPKGEYKEWEKDVNGRLALIILCDQFSRNMYRQTRKMYEFDPIALHLTLRSITQQVDNTLPLIYRLFLYMPLMHSEDSGHQEISLQHFGKLVNESKVKNPANTHYYEYSFDYAQKHQAIVKRFGRFPHRNAVLGRASTREEEEFLKKPGSSF